MMPGSTGRTSSIAFAASLFKRLAALARNRRGGTAVEYALIAAGIGATVAVAMGAVGTNLRVNYYDKLLDLF